MVYEGVITGKTVRLRSVEERDAEITYKMRSDPEKSRFFHAAKGTVADQLAYIRRQREEEGDYLFMIEDLQGNPIGMKGLYHHAPEKREIESGRFVGFGSQVQNMEALILSCDFAFDNLHVDTIHMAALEHNAVMLGIQKKLGVVFTDREKLEDLGCDNLHSVLTRSAYDVNRPKVYALINRFADRI